MVERVMDQHPMFFLIKKTICHSNSRNVTLIEWRHRHVWSLHLAQDLSEDNYSISIGAFDQKVIFSEIWCQILKFTDGYLNRSWEEKKIVFETPWSITKSCWHGIFFFLSLIKIKINFVHWENYLHLPSSKTLYSYENIYTDLTWILE